MKNDSLTPMRHLTVGVALGELGRAVREQGPNWSPRIEEYHANLDPPIELTREQGYAWCAMFVQFCSDEVVRLGMADSNPLDGVVREALVQDYFTFCEKRGWRIGPEQADAGDLVLYDFSGEGWWDHIGFVVQPPDTEVLFKAIEGNTNSQGGREGVEVAIRPRDLADDYSVAFARWDGAL